MRSGRKKGSEMLMSKHKREDITWPPQCCVAAFLYSALEGQGVKYESPLALPALLGTNVGPGDKNPLNLPINSDKKLRGLTVSRAVATFAEFFKNECMDLAFRYIAFKEVPLALYGDVLKKALSENISVGLGMDVSYLALHTSSVPANHVFRVTAFDGAEVLLVDESGECETRIFKKEIEVIERAVLAADNGFWLVGPQQKIHNVSFL